MQEANNMIMSAMFFFYNNQFLRTVAIYSKCHCIASWPVLPSLLSQLIPKYHFTAIMQIQERVSRSDLRSYLQHRLTVETASKTISQPH